MPIPNHETMDTLNEAVISFKYLLLTPVSMRTGAAARNDVTRDLVHCTDTETADITHKSIRTSQQSVFRRRKRFIDVSKILRTLPAELLRTNFTVTS